MLNRTKIVRMAAAVGGATTLTLSAVWMLGVLNAQAAMTQSSPNDVRTVMVHAPQNDTAPQEEKEPEPEEPEQEVMTVDLSLPTPEPVVPEPLDLDFNLPQPAVAPIQVSVSRQPAKPRQAASAPAAPAQPAPPRRSDQVDQPPREASGNPAPSYPAREQSLGVEGLVKLMILIDEQGQVEDIRVLEGADVFRQAVLNVAWRWRFAPARHEGRTVKVWGVKEVQFTLRGRG